MLSRRFHGGSNDGLSNLCSKLSQLKRQIQAERIVSIREKLKKNKRKVEFDVSQFSLKASRKNLLFLVDNGFSTVPLCKFSGFPQGLGANDYDIYHDLESLTSTELPFVEKIPRYTTWAFIDRNQKLFEYQSAVGSIHAYGQGQHKKEALICNGGEEDNEEPEEEKREFIDGEDRILWTILQEYGLGEQVLNIVSQFIGVAISDIKGRYSKLVKEKNHDKNCKAACGSGDSGYNERGICLETTLNAALDTFDSLFCRRCLVFDCRLHGCPPTLILASEKQPVWSESEDARKPCGDHCCLQVRAEEDVGGGSTVNVPQRDNDTDLVVDERCNSGKVPSVTSKALSVSEVSEVSTGASNTDTSMQNLGKGKAVQDSTLVPYGIQHASKTRKKLYPWDIIRALSENRPSPVAKSRHHIVGASNALDPQRNTKDSQSKSNESRKLVMSSSEWKPIEKELYLKGVEIFGRNSCLIARNLLSGLKTCTDVFNYMRDSDSGSSLKQKSVAPSSFSEENGNANTDHTGQEIKKRRRLFRKRGKARKLKYTYRKNTGQPSIRKKAADDKTMSRKHYTPCGCGTMCGKQCPCLLNETRCEKYCGCSKSCKNRFRGCHCAKKHCRTKQCPCFASTRECDPDICRNCWVSCGDGTLGEPPKQGRNQFCGNMKLLLRKKKRILLSKSEVAGWGAFLQKSVNKDDFLGEYAGEMVCYPEADERGTIEKCGPKSAFLFDLNNQYVLDAHRKGNKLKFANHSATPNCYAQAMLVAGDHRVGIYAKEPIEAGEELFFDYMIGPAQAPPWARKPGDSEPGSSSAAEKLQSH